MPVWRGDDIAGVGDTTPSPGTSSGTRTSATAVLAGREQGPELLVRPAGVPPAGAGHVRQRGAAIRCAGPSFQSWDIALFKNVPLGGTKRLQLRAEFFNFLNHPNLGDPNAADSGVSNDPPSADFGRVSRKTGERNIQLGVKFMF